MKTIFGSFLSVSLEGSVQAKMKRVMMASRAVFLDIGTSLKLGFF